MITQKLPNLIPRALCFLTCAASLFLVGCVFAQQENAPIRKTKIDSQKRKLKKIGVQLYTVRAEMEKDFDGTLRRIASLGYDEVEFAGLFGRDPVQVKKLLADLNIKPVASHINWTTLKKDPQSAIDETLALGADYMIIAWFPPETRDSLKDWEDWISVFNSVGKMSHEQGLKFAYHNHDFEFMPVDGVVPYDLLLNKLDRRYVVMEIDLYWLALGGKEPDALFSEYPGGFHLAHVKDMSKTEQVMVDVGDGRIDFAGIFAESKAAGLRHFIVEHDDTKDPFKSLERSIKYLRQLEY
jgi:sugar phosphate isomerase/epimerase